MFTYKKNQYPPLLNTTMIKQALQDGVHRNIIVFDKNASPGIFSLKLISLMYSIAKENNIKIDRILYDIFCNIDYFIKPGVIYFDLLVQPIYIPSPLYDYYEKDLGALLPIGKDNLIIGMGEKDILLGAC